MPEHPTALAVLAKLASPDDDPRAFADAKLREAESATDDDVKIAALMAAGWPCAIASHDSARARATYERVLALRPYHADATWALAGLVEKGGDPDTAAAAREAPRRRPLEPPEKARILTQLAALSRAAGVEPAAERRLPRRSTPTADHVPAIIALADFYADAERWNDLEAFLREILAEGVPGATPPVIAELHRRLAHAHEKLGRDEDAYQTLVAADRLHRGHLLIKLALGENRYKARRWREAALHLSAARDPRGRRALSERGRAGPLSRRARRDSLPAPREGAAAVRARARAQAELRAGAAGARRDRDGARRSTAAPPIC